MKKNLTYLFIIICLLSLNLIGMAPKPANKHCPEVCKAHGLVYCDAAFCDEETGCQCICKSKCSTTTTTVSKTTVTTEGKNKEEAAKKDTSPAKPATQLTTKKEEVKTEVKPAATSQLSTKKEEIKTEAKPTTTSQLTTKKEETTTVAAKPQLTTKKEVTQTTTQTNSPKP